MIPEGCISLWCQSKENDMISKYVIQDAKTNKWLKIDRVVHGMDIVTTVEYVSSFRAGTIFNKEETANKILECIKEEGNYDITDCAVFNVETYFQDEINKHVEKCLEYLKKSINKDTGNPPTEEEIEEVLEKEREACRKEIEKQFS